MSEEKRIAGDYEIIQSVHIGDREIVVGENQADTDGLPYLVAYYESNAIIGRYYDAVGSNDFPEIMEIYGQRIMEQAQKIGTVLLVSVFALCFALAVWKLSGDDEKRTWDRETILVERYDQLAAAQLEQSGDNGAEPQYKIVLQSMENKSAAQSDLP